MAPVTGSAQAIAAVAVTMAVAATAAGVGMAVYEAPSMPVLKGTYIISTCGLVDLEFRDGTFTLFLEGFPRAFTERETRLVDNLVVDSYNEVTRG
jgi:hypothetical protein